MNKPRIFLGSSGERAKLLRAIAKLRKAIETEGRRGPRRRVVVAPLRCASV